MAVFHYVQLRAFAHATEDPEKVRLAMRTVAGEDKVAFEEAPVEGSHGNRILILEADVRSAPAAKRLFRTLARDDPEGFARVREEAARRLDENLNFHLRLDKQEACLGNLRLSATDDAITVRAKVRSFSSRRSGAGADEALDKLTSFLDEIEPIERAPDRTVVREDSSR